jgi:hypothetical protein
MGIHSWKGDASSSLKNYKITASFEVDAQGIVNLYKDTVFKIAEEEIGNANLLFHTRPIEVALDNADRLSITGAQ